MSAVADAASTLPSQAQRLSQAGVAGPLFISVGSSEQLSKFLSLNPELSGAPALIDDSPTFEAYRAAGFNYLLGDRQLEPPPDFKPPIGKPSERLTTACPSVR